MLQVKKRSAPQIVAFYIFLAPILLNFLQNYLYIPSLVKYTVDVALILALFFIAISRDCRIRRNILPFVVFICIYFLYVLTCYLFVHQSPFYFLWGLRNNIRYYIAFAVFAYFLDTDDIKLCFSVVDVLFALHTVMTLMQYFAFGYKGDYLGGIFGTEVGCNGHSLIFLCVVCIKSIVMFMNGQEKLFACLLKNSISLVIAVMSELKFFFLLLPMILLMASLITRFSVKKVCIVICVFAVCAVSLELFTVLWGSDNALSLERINELLTSSHYSSSKDIGRYSAIPTISKNFLKTVPQKLFGLGLGNCDTSSFAICNTPFYQLYSALNYHWFSSSFILLETGFVGLAIVFTFFGLVFFAASKIKKRNNQYSAYCQIAMLSSIICIVLIFYNSSLRTDIGFLAYFFLAIPFCLPEKQDL